MRTITARGGTDIFYKVGTVRVAKAVFLSVITPPMLKLNANADGLRIVPFNHQRRSPRRSVADLSGLPLSFSSNVTRS